MDWETFWNTIYQYRGIIYILIGVFALYLLIRRLIDKVSPTLGHFSALLQLIQDDQERLHYQPRSVKGMTRIYLPQISKHFPEFNWPQFKQNAEEDLRKALNCYELGRIVDIPSRDLEFRKFLQSQLEIHKEEGISYSISNIQIHQTVISNYIKKEGAHFLELESSLGMNYQKYKDGKLILGDETKPTQGVYTLHYQYIQKKELFEGGFYVEKTCPHCGAPLLDADAKYCPYCQSPVQREALEHWVLTKIVEDVR